MNILFYDTMASLTYDGLTPLTQGLGGTEATTIRIAESLAAFHSVYIAQHSRASTDNHEINGVHYVSLETAHQLTPDAVIILRQYKLLEEIAKRFPNARRFLWLHNMPSARLHKIQSLLLKYQYEIIAVSEFHRTTIEKRLQGRWYQRFFNKQYSTIPINVLYNPIDNDLQSNEIPIKKEQLIFTSSPTKGLEKTLALFSKVQSIFPEYELLIANPGYAELKLNLPTKTRFLGALPHAELIQYIRESFCVFYPQNEKIETFGLVYAEANAVGTPVLAHEWGAAREVLSDPCQLVDGSQLNAIVNKLKEWREKRPTLQGKHEFRLSNVTQSWLALLNKAENLC